MWTEAALCTEADLWTEADLRMDRGRIMEGGRIADRGRLMDRGRLIETWQTCGYSGRILYRGKHKDRGRMVTTACRLVGRDGRRETCEQRWKQADLWTEMEIGGLCGQRCKQAGLWTKMERGRNVDRDGKRQTCGQRWKGQTCGQRWKEADQLTEAEMRSEKSFIQRRNGRRWGSDRLSNIAKLQTEVHQWTDAQRLIIAGSAEAANGATILCIIQQRGALSICLHMLRSNLYVQILYCFLENDL